MEQKERDLIDRIASVFAPMPATSPSAPEGEPVTWWAASVQKSSGSPLTQAQIYQAQARLYDNGRFPRLGAIRFLGSRVPTNGELATADDSYPPDVELEERGMFIKNITDDELEAASKKYLALLNSREEGLLNLTLEQHFGLIQLQQWWNDKATKVINDALAKEEDARARRQAEQAQRMANLMDVRKRTTNREQFDRVTRSLNAMGLHLKGATEAFGEASRSAHDFGLAIDITRPGSRQERRARRDHDMSDDRRYNAQYDQITKKQRRH